MAIAHQPKSTWDREATTSRVRHPLQRLRSYIRTYVTLEGLAVFLLYMALWFWIGLLLDFGVFKLFAYDWVQEMPKMVGDDSFRVVRVSMLVVLLSGLLAVVATQVVLRLLREFRDSALALVLERRFPEQLGDRLITAVEMADPRLSEKYGHSQVMLDQTIRDAADRVDRVPVTEVFNWKRLARYGLVLAGLTVGLVLLFGTAYCLLADEDVGKFYYRSRDVAGIWAERNLLLKDTLWPRSAYLEVIRFKGSKKDKNEMRIGDNNPSAELWVRSVRWVIADPEAPDGWRPLRWADLKVVLGRQPKIDLPAEWGGWVVDIDDLDPSVPAYGIPETWHGKNVRQVRDELERVRSAPELLGVALPRPRTVRELLTPAQFRAMEQSLFGWRNWTVDRIALQLGSDYESVSAEMRANHEAARKQFEQVFEELDDLVESGAFEREVRKLDVPSAAVVNTYGEANKGRKSFSKREDNKYQVRLGLTESVRFVVQGEDYYTPEKKITLVPRPRVRKLLTNRWEPAYIYYRMRGKPGDLRPQLALRGQKQRFREVPVSVADKEVYIELPAHSHIELACETTDLLKEKPRIEAGKKDAEGSYSARELLERTPVAFAKSGGAEDRHHFTARFDDVRRTLDFFFRFTNDDNVEGECHVIIEPKADRHPDVSVQMVENIFRKQQNTEFYMVTPYALVPFKGNILDDRGLDRVEWAFRAEVVKQEAATYQVMAGMTAHQFTPGGPNAVMGPAYLAWLAKRLKATQGDKKEAPVETVLLKRFVDEIARGQEAEVGPDELAKKKNQKPPEQPLLKQIVLRGEEDAFDFMENLRRLETPGDPAFQTRYLVELWVLATDNNVDSPDGKPAVSESKQRFTFLVVGENELLAAIFREEEDLRADLEKIFAKLLAARTKFDTQVLPGLGNANLDADSRSLKATRADEVKRVIRMNSKDIGGVRAAFNRILEEMRHNNIRKKTDLSRVRDQICEPLRAMMDKSRGEFVLAENAVENLQNILEQNGKDREKAGQLAKEHVDKLIARLRGVLDSMQNIIDKDALVRMLVEEQERQRKQSEALEAHAEFLKRDLEKDLSD
jgi:hypothetical protein